MQDSPFRAFRSSLLSFHFSLSLILSTPPAMVPRFLEGEPPGNGRALWGTRTDGERTQDDAGRRTDGVCGHPDCDWLVSPPLSRTGHSTRSSRGRSTRCVTHPRFRPANALKKNCVLNDSSAKLEEKLGRQQSKLEFRKQKRY